MSELTLIIKNEENQTILEVSGETWKYYGSPPESGGPGHELNRQDIEESKNIRNFLRKVIEHLQLCEEVDGAIELAQTFHIEPYASISTLLDSWNQQLREKGLNHHPEVVDYATNIFLIERCEKEIVKSNLGATLKKKWKQNVNSPV